MPVSETSERGAYEIWADESRIRGPGEFLCLGGLTCSTETATRLKERCLGIVRSEGFRRNSDLKWTKLTSQRSIQIYGQIVDEALNEINSRNLLFCCFIVPRKLYPLRHPIFSEDDQELGFYIYYRELLWEGLMRMANKLHQFRGPYKICLDQRTDHVNREYRLAILRNALIGRARDYWNIPNFLPENISSVVSHGKPLLWIVDIVMGAIAAKYNRDCTSRSKLRFIEFLEQRLNKKLDHDFGPWDWEVIPFNGWRFCPAGGQRWRLPHERRRSDEALYSFSEGCWQHVIGRVQ